MSQVRVGDNIHEGGKDAHKGSPAPPATGNKVVQPTSYANPCGYPQTHDGSDLCAQWTAAVAARDSSGWQAAAYPWQVGSTVAMGLSLLLSLVAAILAYKAFKSTERTERAQTRAYLFVSSVAVVDGSLVEGDREYVPGAIIEIKNYGKTPAHDVQIWAAVGYGPTDPAHNPPEPNMAECGENMTVFAPDSGNTYARPLVGDPHAPGENTFCLLPELTEQVARGQSGLYIYGRAVYRDVFDQKRHASFRYVFTGKWPPKPEHMVSICTRGNESD